MARTTIVVNTALPRYSQLRQAMADLLALVRQQAPLLRRMTPAQRADVFRRHPLLRDALMFAREVSQEVRGDE